MMRHLAESPPAVPAVLSDGAGSRDGCSIRAQVGGMMRSEKLFRRIILRYSINGQV